VRRAERPGSGEIGGVLKHGEHLAALQLPMHLGTRDVGGMRPVNPTLPPGRNASRDLVHEFRPRRLRESFVQRRTAAGVTDS
jgi:hypothetical protein